MRAGLLDVPVERVQIDSVFAASVGMVVRVLADLAVGAQAAGTFAKLLQALTHTELTAALPDFSFVGVPLSLHPPHPPPPSSSSPSSSTPSTSPPSPSGSGTTLSHGTLTAARPSTVGCRWGPSSESLWLAAAAAAASSPSPSRSGFAAGKRAAAGSAQAVLPRAG